MERNDSQRAFQTALPARRMRLTRQVNRMCESLTTQVRSIGSVTTAVAKGDLSKMIEIEAEGEMAVLKNVRTRSK